MDWSFAEQEESKFSITGFDVHKKENFEQTLIIKDTNLIAESMKNLEKLLQKQKFVVQQIPNEISY